MALAWEAQSTEFRVRERPGRVNRAHAPFMPYPTAEARLAPRQPSLLPAPPKSAPSAPLSSDKRLLNPSKTYIPPEPHSFPPLPPPPSLSSSKMSHNHYRSKTLLYPRTEEKNAPAGASSPRVSHGHYRSKTRAYPRTEEDNAPARATDPGPYAATRWEGVRSAYAERRRGSAEIYNPDPSFSIYDVPEDSPLPPPGHHSPPSDRRPASESEMEEGDDDDDDEDVEREREYFPPPRVVYQSYNTAVRTTERGTSVSASGSSEQAITPIESYERSSNPELPPTRLRTYASSNVYHRNFRNDSISPPPTVSDEYARQSSYTRYTRSASRSTISSREISPLSDEPEGPPPAISPTREGRVWSRRKRGSVIDIPDIYRQEPRTR